MSFRLHVPFIIWNHPKSERPDSSSCAIVTILSKQSSHSRMCKSILAACSLGHDPSQYCLSSASSGCLLRNSTALHPSVFPFQECYIETKPEVDSLYVALLALLRAEKRLVWFLCVRYHFVADRAPMTTNRSRRKGDPILFIESTHHSATFFSTTCHRVLTGKYYLLDSVSAATALPESEPRQPLTV
jgi:hypothetical protein